MIKVFKILCTRNIDFGENGKCEKDNVYYSRINENKSLLVLTNENKWVNMTNPKYFFGFDIPIENIQYKTSFKYISDRFVTNKKELKNLKNF